MASGIAVSASPMWPIASGGGAQPIELSDMGNAQIVASHSTTAQVNKASAPDYQWSEWREYDHGTFFPRATGWFEQASIKVMRRDAQATSARYYQVKLCGVFGSTRDGVTYDPIDFVITVHPDGHMSWDEQETNVPYTYNGSTRNMWIPAGEGDAIHSFSTKRYVNFPMIWVYAYIDGGFPYGLQLQEVGYLSDNHLESNFSMALPGTSENYGTNKLPFTVGNLDPGWTVKMVVSRGVYTYNDDDYSGTIAQALALRRYKGQVYDLNVGLNEIPVDGPGYYYINFVIFDPDGDWWSWQYSRQTYAGPDGYEWEPMGIGELQIGFFKNYFGSISKDNDGGYSLIPNIAGGEYVEPYQVKVERRKDAPGVIRIVNPFGSETPFAKISEVKSVVKFDNNEFESAFMSFFNRSNDYYTVIDTRSEPYPYEVDYPCGFQLWTYDYGSTTFTDMHSSIFNNTPQYYYKVDVGDRKISINDDYLGNMLELTLPTGGVSDINADDPLSPATYYNLQGIEVSNPQKGQLLIRRCGTHTDKIVY